MIPAKCNYQIYDKELLAIVRSFEVWRKHPEPLSTPTNISYDHGNVGYLMSTEVLNRQQAHRAQILSGHKFLITYRPGPRNGKPDALTRRSGNLPGKGDERFTPQCQVLLKVKSLKVWLPP